MPLPRRAGTSASTPLPGRFTAPLLVVAASFVAAGGYVHLREWLDTYRHVPAGAAGSVVVRVGFPLNAALSLVLAAALVYNACRRSRFTPHVIVAAVAFQAASLGVLIATRTGTFLGWSEPSWTLGADQTRAVQIGALVSLAAAAGLLGTLRLAAARAT